MKFLTKSLQCDFACFLCTSFTRKWFTLICRILSSKNEKKMKPPETDCSDTLCQCARGLTSFDGREQEEGAADSAINLEYAVVNLW